jgi:NitT/TauT family transport system permease protein
MKFLPLLPLILVTFFLEWASRSGWIPTYLFPAPSQVFNALNEGSAEFLAAFLETLLASVVGLFLSFLCGLGIAIALSLSITARKIFYPYAVFFQTVPIIAIAPLLVIWFGYGQSTVIASAFIVSIFPIIANTVNGFLSTDPTLLQLFQVVRATRLQSLLRLRVPFALPQILAGIKISSGLAVIGAIVGEFISGSGLGGLVDAARNQQRIDRVFAAVLCAAALGVLFFASISVLNHLLLGRWHASERK